MNNKLKIHFFLKALLIKLDYYNLLPNFVKKLSRIIFDVSYNYSFERKYNGEESIVKNLYKENIKIDTIFDVGANKGFWSDYFYKFFNKSKFFLFEITPSRLKILNKIDIKNFNIINFGLAEKDKDLFFYDYSSLDGENSIFNTRPDTKSKKIKSKFLAGDTFCKKNNINFIDFLKIDVEGMEYEVLKGFNNMLKNKKIKIIQFEYTIANSISKYMLKDISSLLNCNNYIIGKLTNKGVIFIKDFKIEMNHFYYGPNFIACNKNHTQLIKKLSNFN